jgi:hypothetical protein
MLITFIFRLTCFGLTLGHLQRLLSKINLKYYYGTQLSIGIVGIWRSVHRTWTSLRHFNGNCQESCQGLDKQRPYEILGLLNRTQTGKGIPTRTLCQKNEGTDETKQKPVAMGDRTTDGTLSPERTPFQNGINGQSHLQKVLRERRISHTYSMWLWGHSLFKISSPGPLFHGTRWLPRRPHKSDTTLHSKCRAVGGVK